MKIIITGALGHIGSKLIRELPITFPDAEICMIDNMSTERYCSLFSLPKNGKYQFIEGDVLTLDLDPIFEGAEIVIHLAAITNAAGSFELKERVEYNNNNATKKVAKVSAKAGVAMVFVSSTSVYGSQSEVVDEECLLSDLQPQSPYAETKLKEEEFLAELGVSAGLRFIIFRFGTIFGISEGMRFHTAVNKFCWQAVMRQPITVWKTALFQKRPYLDLSDAMEAFMFVINRDHFDNRIYNVLTLNSTVNDIVETIRKNIPELTIKYVDTEIMNQLSYDICNKRFKKLGFKFRGNLEKRIRETIYNLAQANRYCS